MNNNFIIRELYHKRSIAHLVHPDIVVADAKNITDKDVTTATDVIDALADESMFSWVKGGSTTAFFSQEAGSRPFNDLLEEMGIGIKVGPKAMKRIARAFSPRDVVAKTDKLTIQILSNEDLDKFGLTPRQYSFTNDETDKLHDGAGAIKLSFALHMAGGLYTPRQLLRAECLSFSAIFNGGMVKSVLRVIKDDVWTWGKNNVIVGHPNIKSELWTTKENVSYISYDVFNHHGDPKTNALFDVCVGKWLYAPRATNLLKAMGSKLAIADAAIRNGNAVKALDQWKLPEQGAELDGRKSNEDFAFLSDMLSDITARGLDYRSSPTLVSMLATAAERPYWSDRKEWPRYPLICAKSRPIVCETQAAIMGILITVERGTIRCADDHGGLFVVNDEDWVEFISEQSGGADFDDHWILLWRKIGNENYVILVRLPCGPGEFTILKYVDGDYYPTFTTPTGDSVSFPLVPGVIPMTNVEKIRNGTMKITGVPDADPLELPDVYDVELIRTIILDVITTSSGYLGQVINAVILAMSEAPELLDDMPCSMESIIDSFTQGGAGATRAFLSNWAKGLVEKVATMCDTVDVTMWDRRAGNPQDIQVSLHRGKWDAYLQDNIAMRRAFSMNVRNWHQQWNASQSNELMNQIAKILSVNPFGVQSSSQAILIVARQILNGYYSMRNELSRTAGKMTPEHWRACYSAVLDMIKTVGYDEAGMELMTLAVWLVGMGAARSDDKMIMNPIVFPTFAKALVRYGIGADIDKTVEITRMDKELGNDSASLASSVTEAITQSWEITCPVCGKVARTSNVSRYADWVMSNRTCQACS